MPHVPDPVHWPEATQPLACCQSEVLTAATTTRDPYYQLHARPRRARSLTTRLRAVDGAACICRDPPCAPLTAETPAFAPRPRPAAALPTRLRDSLRATSHPAIAAKGAATLPTPAMPPAHSHMLTPRVRNGEPQPALTQPPEPASAKRDLTSWWRTFSKRPPKKEDEKGTTSRGGQRCSGCASPSSHLLSRT